jgi:hypothetical protein
MASVSESVIMALAARNEIVRRNGKCTLSLEVIWSAIEAALKAQARQSTKGKPNG